MSLSKARPLDPSIQKFRTNKPRMRSEYTFHHLIQRVTPHHGEPMASSMKRWQDISCSMEKNIARPLRASVIYQATKQPFMLSSVRCERLTHLKVGGANSSGSIIMTASFRCTSTR